jgi:hypothetical protein
LELPLQRSHLAGEASLGEFLAELLNLPLQFLNALCLLSDTDFGYLG